MHTENGDSSSSSEDYVIMVDAERFSMTEASLCALLLDRFIHDDRESLQFFIEYGNNSPTEAGDNNAILFKKIEEEFERKKQRNEFYSLRTFLNFCLQAANMGRPWSIDFICLFTFYFPYFLV